MIITIEKTKPQLKQKTGYEAKDFMILLGSFWSEEELGCIRLLLLEASSQHFCECRTVMWRSSAGSQGKY